MENYKKSYQLTSKIFMINTHNSLSLI